MNLSLPSFIERGISNRKLQFSEYYRKFDIMETVVICSTTAILQKGEEV